MDVVAAGSGAGALLGRTLRDALQTKSVLLHFNSTIVRVVPVRVAPWNTCTSSASYKVMNVDVEEGGDKSWERL